MWENLLSYFKTDFYLKINGGQVTPESSTYNIFHFFKTINVLAPTRKFRIGKGAGASFTS